VENASDATKIFKVDVSGVTTATTRTLAIPDQNGTIALTSDLHDPVTVLDTATINFGLTGQEITGDVIQSGISHTSISDIGTNTHAQIDTHIADDTIHFTQAAISITASQVSDFDTEVSNNVDVANNTTHTTLTNNPHSVSLEQVRSVANSISGDINANSNTITGLTSPTLDSDAATKGYVDSLINGLDWQESVKDRYDPTSALPPTPSTGDRYISIATANGWTVNYIYEYNGTSWDEIIPDEGFAT
jgi:predicted ATP-dependent Lon-type protease